MTLIEMEGFLRGKCIPRDMLVNESNAQYLLRKLTELQKENETLRAMMRELEIQRDALVAENAALKSKGLELISEASAVYELQNKIIGPEDFIDGQTLHEFREIVETGTATDAAIAEIGAKAVDGFCSVLGEHYKNFKPKSIQGKTIKWSVMQGVSYTNKLRGGGV